MDNRREFWRFLQVISSKLERLTATTTTTTTSCGGILSIIIHAVLSELSLRLVSFYLAISTTCSFACFMKQNRNWHNQRTRDEGKRCITSGMMLSSILLKRLINGASFLPVAPNCVIVVLKTNLVSKTNKINQGKIRNFRGATKEDFH